MELLKEAVAIIDEHAPGYTVWLDRAWRLLELGDIRKELAGLDCQVRSLLVQWAKEGCNGDWDDGGVCLRSSDTELSELCPQCRAEWILVSTSDE
jgi:hypothetical protein